MPRLRSEGPSLRFSGPLLIGFEPETLHIMLMKSHGFSCSRSSYSREIGRMACSATMWVNCCMFLTESDRSKSIMVVAPSHDGQTVEGGKSARIAQPELHHVITDVSVPPEYLDAIVGDLEGRVGGILASEVRLARRRQTAVDPPRRLPREQPHGVHLGRHVGQLEGDRLFLRDGDPERAPLLGVVPRVVEGRPG